MRLKMDYKKIQEKVNSLIGQKLTNVCTAAEMLRFYFDNDHGIHSLCLTRVRKKEDILLTSFDYYNWDEKDDKNNDEWYYLEKYKEDIVFLEDRYNNILSIKKFINLFLLFYRIKIYFLKNIL